jgi:hypothetical protein
VRNIIKSSRLKDYKSDDMAVFQAFKTTPLEVIDGIDTEIRDRLNDYNIKSVQNLAAANPLMLFVETPYGVYQIIDWVAQAQLCSSVGPKKMVRLWELGVRTIFDLERIALDPACKQPDLLKEVGEIVLGKTPKQDDPNVPGRHQEFTIEAVVADIRTRLEAPHVHRLRQIVMRVGDRLGSDYRRLPPILDCLNRDNTKCLFASPPAAKTAPPPARAAKAVHVRNGANVSNGALGQESTLE